MLSSIDRRVRSIRGNDCRGGGPGHISMRRYAEPPRKADILVGFRVTISTKRSYQSECP